MKVGRQQLKALVKECLVEILVEGLDASSSVSKPTAESREPERRGPRNRDLDPLPQQFQRGPIPTPRRRVEEYAQPQHRGPEPERRVPAVVVPKMSDPVMNSIFADTAATTLLEQEDPGRVIGDQATQAAARMDPTKVFDEEQIDIWNRAAFGSGSPRGSSPSSHALMADFMNDLLSNKPA